MPPSLISHSKGGRKVSIVLFPIFRICVRPFRCPPMAPQVASIQSFFQPEVHFAEKTPKPPAPLRPNDTADGFTPSELEAALHPALHPWQPRTTYDETNIGDLVAGPGCVALMGRIVNFHNITTPSKTPKAAQGCFKLTVKDDTGAVTVSNLSTILLPLSHPLPNTHR